MSSKTACLFAALLMPIFAPAQEPSLTAEQALANYRALTSAEPVQSCDRSGDPDEIVVCGRDDSARFRLPLRDERGPPDGARRATGEVPSPGAMPKGIGEGTYVGVDIPRSIGLIADGVKKILDPDR